MRRSCLERAQARVQSNVIVIRGVHMTLYALLAVLARNGPFLHVVWHGGPVAVPARRLVPLAHGQLNLRGAKNHNIIQIVNGEVI